MTRHEAWIGTFILAWLTIVAPAIGTGYTRYLNAAADPGGDGTTDTTTGGTCAWDTFADAMTFISGTMIDADSLTVEITAGTYTETGQVAFTSSHDNKTLTFRRNGTGTVTVTYSGSTINHLLYQQSSYNTTNAATVAFENIGFQYGDQSSHLIRLDGTAGHWAFMSVDFDLQSASAMAGFFLTSTIDADISLTLDACTYTNIAANGDCVQSLGWGSLYIQNHNTTVAAGEFVVILDDTDYVEIDSNTLDTPGGRLVRCVRYNGSIYGNNRFIRITNNTLNGQGVISCTDADSSNLTAGIIAHNTIVRDAGAVVTIYLGEDDVGSVINGIGSWQVYNNTIRSTSAATNAHLVLLGFGIGNVQFFANRCDCRSGSNLGLVLKGADAMVNFNTIIGYKPILIKGGSSSEVAFNSLYATGAGLVLDAREEDGTHPSADVRIHHNILVGSSSYTRVFESQPTAVRMWFEYNLYYKNGATNVALVNSTTCADLSAVRTAWATDEDNKRGEYNDANSVEGNPLFTNVGTGVDFDDLNFRLRPGSLAIGAGILGGNVGWFQRVPRRASGIRTGGGM